MTFTFKLARRLARTRRLAGMTLIVLLGGSCAPGKPLEGGLEPPPDDVLSIQLFPDSVSLNPSEFVDFTAIAELSGGGTAQVAVTWEAQGGSMNPSGRYTAGGNAGSYRVIGRHSSGKADTSVVVVKQTGGPVQTGIQVSPTTAALLPNGTQTFTAQGTMSNGNTTAVTVTWSATGGSIDANGLYQAPGTAGSFLVVATQQGGTFADTAQVNVSVPPPTLSAVILTPPSASLEFTRTQQFSAVGQLSDGSTTSIPITWTATGGTVNSSGLYTAGSTAGTFRVIAGSANGLADTSSITVTAPTITGITLTPATVSLQSGQTQQFSVSATLSNGGTQTNPAVTWTATGGAVNSSGLYTAGATAGSFVVIATSSNGRADTSSVTVTLPTITSITLTPPTASVQSGQTRQFSASATLSNGATLTNPTVTWSATGGTITTSGLYTAGSTAGTFRVIAASATGPADTSSVTVTAAPTVTAISVTPPSASLQSGQTQQFSASATLSDGSTQSNPGVTWIATGGTVTSSGLYTAGSTTGSFRVIASSSNGVADTSAITISTPTVTAIVLTPSTATVAPGGTQQFSVSATLSNGGSQSNPAVTYSATGGTISSGGLYTAGTTVGTFRVIAVQQGGTLADTSQVTIVSSSEPVYQAGVNRLLHTDNFDSYAIKPAGPWDNTPNGTSMVTPGRGGSGEAARITYTPSDYYGGFDLAFSETPRIFVSYWFRISPAGYDVVEGDNTGSGMKWFTLWRPSAARQTWGANQLGGVSGTTFGTHDNSSSAMPNPVNGASGLWYTVNDGQWHRYTIEAYTGTGTDGYERCWLDGVKIFDTSGRGYDRSTQGFNLLQIGHDKVKAPLGTRFLDIDDFTAWTP